MNTLNEINKLLAKESKRKLTVKDLENHAKDVYDYGNLTTMQMEFYKGFIRAIELLRKHKLLKE